ncbi:MAG: hypothetical protein MUF40_07765 [Gemmatimonadaceae bacterium]|nr:hypothetical protein [Gemmatimonadaceae bacterium]
MAAAVAVQHEDALRLALRLGFTPMGETDGPIDRLRTFRLERDAASGPHRLAGVRSGA